MLLLLENLGKASSLSKTDNHESLKESAHIVYDLESFSECLFGFDQFGV
jgi:hypothetical protein